MEKSEQAKTLVGKTVPIDSRKGTNKTHFKGVKRQGKCSEGSDMEAYQTEQ